MEESPPEPSTSTGESRVDGLKAGRTIEAEIEVIPESPVASGRDAPNDEIDIMVEALVHEGHLQPQRRRYQ